jgi:polar amino acid transport system substrate-binding protein
MLRYTNPDARPGPASRFHAALLGFAALALCAALPALAAAQVLVFATDGVPPHSRPDGTGFEDRIVAEACRRIGFEARMERQPSERCLLSAESGAVDGVYVRVAGLSPRYQGLVMVREPMSEYAFTAFTRRRDLRIVSWSDLRPYRVGAVIGWKLVEDNTREMPRLTMVRDEEALFTLLAQDRADVVIGGLYAGRRIARAKGLADVRAIEPPLALKPMYIYLNHRNASLAPRLSAALRAMRADGTLDRLMREGLEGDGK